MQRQKRYKVAQAKTRTIYARIPIDLGAEVERYGQARALTLTAAVIALLRAGLSEKSEKVEATA